MLSVELMLVQIFSTTVLARVKTHDFLSSILREKEKKKKRKKKKKDEKKKTKHCQRLSANHRLREFFNERKMI